MAKHKKRKSETSAPKSILTEPLNNPFVRLKELLPVGIPDKEDVPPAAPEVSVEEEDERVLFRQAMHGVSPVSRACPQRVRILPAPAPVPRGLDEDLEVLAGLADLVSGTGTFDLRHSDEYAAGAWPGINPELMRRLAKGEFPIQAYMDLHGMGLETALQAVEDFFKKSLLQGLRHVLLVPGRGIGSPEGMPVLKPLLVEWLGTKRLRKLVLGFCTALPRDGGEGALYVLLRRWTRQGFLRL